jgi:hypothetical protein
MLIIILICKQGTEIIPIDLDTDQDSITSIGKSNHKRKAESELLTNRNTVKARKRNEALKADLIREQVEKAKAADQGAITYSKKKLIKSERYLQASESKKAALVQENIKQVTLKQLD